MHAEDDAEFSDFVRSSSTALLRTAWLLTGDADQARDLLQTGLERTYRHWRRLRSRGGDPLMAYVRRTMVNAHTDSWRRRRGTTERAQIVDRVTAADPTGRLDLRDALVRALLTLPARQRAVLVLRYFDDLTEAETAQTLGISAGTVKSQSARALARLRASVEDLGLAEPRP